MKTLYVTDLDGTLLNRQSQISEYSINVINQLVEKGTYFTYATARSLSTASIITKELKTNIPVITYNGAFTIDALTGKILSSVKYSNTQKQFIIDILKKHNIYPMVYAYIDGVEKVSWVHGKENYGIDHYINLRKDDSRLNPLTSENNLYQGDVFHFTCIGEKEELLPIYNALKDHNDYNCIFYQELYREEYWCEIMHKKSTKANAILELKKTYNFDKVIVFGDAINDIPMFSIADECYAVENAVNELKNIATGIIDSNDNNGVAKWLKLNAK